MRDFSQEIRCTYSEEIDLHVHGERFHGLYALDLMIHFLAEERFLNIHSDILLNLTPGA